MSDQDGRVVKALDLRSNRRMSAWVRTPLLVVKRQQVSFSFQTGFVTINGTVFLVEPLPSVDILHDLDIHCKPEKLQQSAHSNVHAPNGSNSTSTQHSNASNLCLGRLHTKLQHLLTSKAHPVDFSANADGRTESLRSLSPYHVIYEHQWSPSHSLTAQKPSAASASGLATDQRIKASSGRN